jgi:hypothetical protein
LYEKRIVRRHRRRIERHFARSKPYGRQVDHQTVVHSLRELAGAGSKVDAAAVSSGKYQLWTRQG